MRYKPWERQKIVGGLRSPQVTSVEKFVLMLLNEWTGMEGYSNIENFELIAEEAILSCEDLGEVINSLRRKGLIRVYGNSCQLIYSAMVQPK